MTPVEILRGARERLTRPEVWVGYCPADDNHECSVTACANLPGAGPNWGTATDYLRVAAAVAEDVSLAAWNDAPGRTLSEVLAAFDQAILLAESA